MQFRILGPLEVEHDGTPVSVGMPRARTLLALLLLSRGEVVDTDRLAEQLWNEAPPRTARHTIHSYVYRLRQAFGGEASRLRTHTTGYRLVCDADELDTRRFAELAAHGHEAVRDAAPDAGVDLFDAALALWRGPPLVDHPDLPALTAERARLEELRLQITEDRFEAQLMLGRHGTASEIEAVAVAHPFRERLWQLLMLALYRAGRPAAALEVFQRARRVLDDELGIEPGPDLAQLQQRILRRDPSLDATADPARPAPLDPKTPRTRFVGRRRELDELHGLVATRRLVTVIGPPGCGKTRLAVEAAGELRHTFPHGVRFASLADLDDPRMLPNAVAAAVGVTAADRRPVAALTSYLRRRRMLLVVDNVEHVLPGAPVFGELLDAAPGLRVLATSRTPLRLSGEQVYPLDPMPLPSRSLDGATVDDTAVDAVTLFSERARMVDPRFAVSDGNVADVAEVVTRTGGLPLAIELAAARLRHLPVAELRRRLGPSLSTLAGGPIDVPQRQQTMRDAIVWSCDLLGDPDRAVFRRLGMFRGGFTLDAAEAVVSGAPGDDVVAAMSRLVDAGLVQPPRDRAAGHTLLPPPRDGSARYTLLEPIREAAVEQLRAAGEERDVTRRHADHFAALAERGEPDMFRRETRGWLDRVDSEHANLRAALQWTRADGDLPTALTLAARLSRAWILRGRVREGRQILEELLAHPAARPHPRARGLALAGLGGLCYWAGDAVAAAASYRHALTLLEPAADHDAYTEGLLWLVVLSSAYLDDLDEATARLRDLERLVEIRSSRRVPADMALSSAVGFVHLGSGDLGGAERAWDRALGTRAHDTWKHARLLRMLAGVHFAQGNPARARERLLSSLGVAADIGDPVGVALDLEHIGLAEALLGRSAHGVILAGAGARLAESVGVGPTFPPAFGTLPTVREVAGRAISDETFQRAWARGRAMSAAAAVTAATHRRISTPDAVTSA